MSTTAITPNNKIKYIIGIDFGHGETSAAYCSIDNDDDPIDLEITPGRKSIPSAICTETTPEGQRIHYIGYQAVNNSGKKDSLFFNAYFKDSPQLMDDIQKEATKDFFAEVYNQILSRNASIFSEGNHVVFIACPSNSERWTEKASREYLQLALDARLPIVKGQVKDYSIEGIIRESRAAYIQLLQDKRVSGKSTKEILVIDFGSSTVDITYHGQEEKPIDKSYPLGAEKVELLILNHLKSFNDHRNNLDTLETTFPGAYKKAEFSIRKSKEDFFKGDSDCLEYKIKYRELTNAKMPIESLSGDLSEEDLASIIRPYIEDIRTKVFKNFKDNYLKDNHVGLLVITGGASRMPFVQELAREIFASNDTAIIPPIDPSLSVSNGLAGAGRADIRLFFLLQQLMEADSVKNAQISNDVYTSAATAMAESVISTLDYEYKHFKDDSNGPRTISSLEKTIKTDISNKKDTFRDSISNAFSSCLKRYTDDKVKSALKKYVLQYFPYYSINSIGTKPISSAINIQLSTEQLSAIQTVIDGSVSAMEEKNLELAAKLIYNLGIAAPVGGGLALIADITIAAKNLGGHLLNYLGVIDYDDKDDDDLIPLSDGVKALAWDFRDKDSVLDYSIRTKVLEEYENNRESNMNKLKSDIKNALEKDISLRDTINSSCKDYVTRYVLSESKKIRSQLK